jgi:hypothetical protein
MKKTVFFIIFLSGILGCTIMAGTFRVNNQLANNPTAKIYSNLQDAHDAAYNGDTLMVEGSPDYYNGFTCTKRLIIKGPGYFLDENAGISANKLPAEVNSIYFSTGSKGSVAMGIHTYFTVYDDDITIRRCYSSQVYIPKAVENLTVSECFFQLGEYNVSIYSTGNAITNLVVMNCVLTGVSLSGGSTGVFLNNIFTPATIAIPTGFVMKNNILFNASKDNVSLPAMPDPDISYNISISDHFGTSNHNQANVSESALFLGALTESTDGKWQLKPESPAIGAGESSIDCGAFGGPQPYILSGLPVGPVIVELNVSGYSTGDNKLPVTIKVKSY